MCSDQITDKSENEWPDCHKSWYSCYLYDDWQSEELAMKFMLYAITVNILG
jgi:hypothetical protein